jgi:uncharacterized protein YbjT (DUF2867 family)
MIVVTGATGNIGRRIVGDLQAGGTPCRAFVRDPAKADALLGDGVETAVGDFADTASIRVAVNGADAVLLSSGNDPRQVEYEANVIDAVLATDPRCRLVKISSVGATATSPAAFVAWHGRSEAHLIRSGLPFTVLRANFFMSNLFAAAEAIAHSGQLAAPAGDARIAMVDPGDVAACAVAVLTGSGHESRTYEVTGPEALTYPQVAGTLSAVLGRSVAFVDAPSPAVRQGLVDAGLREWFADGLITLFAALRDGIAAATTDTVHTLTGRPPRTLAEFLRDHAKVFSAAAPATAAS